jgi:hypothetical protein
MSANGPAPAAAGGPAGTGVRVAEAGPVRGIGRFARPRVGPPKRL